MHSIEDRISRANVRANNYRKAAETYRNLVVTSARATEERKSACKAMYRAFCEALQSYKDIPFRTREDIAKRRENAAEELGRYTEELKALAD